jgi:hypothetical protein
MDIAAIKRTNAEILERRPFVALLIYKQYLCVGGFKKNTDDKVKPYDPSKRKFIFDIQSLKRIDGCAHMLYSIHSFDNAKEGIASMLCFPLLTTRVNNQQQKETLFDRSFLSSWVPYVASPNSYFTGNIFVGVKKSTPTPDEVDNVLKHEHEIKVHNASETKAGASSKKKKPKSNKSDDNANEPDPGPPLFTCKLNNDNNDADADDDDDDKMSDEKKSMEYTVRTKLVNEGQSGKQNPQITDILKKVPGIQNATIGVSDKYNIYSRSRQLMNTFAALSMTSSERNIWSAITLNETMSRSDKVAEFMLLYDRDMPLLTGTPADHLNSEMTALLEKSKNQSNKQSKSSTTTKASIDRQKEISLVSNKVTEFKSRYLEEEKYTLSQSVFTLAESLKDETVKIQEEITNYIATNVKNNNDSVNPTKKRKIDTDKNESQEKSSKETKVEDSSGTDKDRNTDLKSISQKGNTDKVDTKVKKGNYDGEDTSEKSKKKPTRKITDSNEEEIDRTEVKKEPKPAAKDQKSKKTESKKAEESNKKGDTLVKKDNRNSKKATNILELGSDDENETTIISTTVNKTLSSDLVTIVDVESSKEDTTKKGAEKNAESATKRQQQSEKSSMY